MTGEHKNSVHQRVVATLFSDPPKLRFYVFGTDKQEIVTAIKPVPHDLCETPSALSLTMGETT